MVSHRYACPELGKGRYFMFLVMYEHVGTNVKAVVVYGGVPTKKQRRNLSRGCNILIGTPGRLLHFIQEGEVCTI